MLYLPLVVYLVLLCAILASGFSEMSLEVKNSAAPASKKVFPIALSLMAQTTSQPSISYLEGIQVTWSVFRSLSRNPFQITIIP
jgi:hypothetical protein